MFTNFHCHINSLGQIEFVRIRSICQLEIVQCFIYGFDTRYGDNIIIHGI